MFAAFASPTFRMLAGASWCYYTYRMMELTVLSWLVLELTDSPAQVALVAVSRATPMFLFGLIAGGIADRFTRKSVMLAAQALNLVVMGAVLAVMLAGTIEAWHVYVAVGATGFTWALDYTSRRAYLASLFSGRRFTNAMSLDIGSLISANLTGPVIGTALIRWADYSGAYMAMMVLGFVGMVFLAMIAEEQGAGVRLESPLRTVAEAFRATRLYPAVMASVLLTAVYNVLGWPITTQIPVIARDVLGASEVLFGILQGGLGAGALIGAVLLATTNPTRRGTTYAAGTFLFLAAAFMFSFSPWYAASVLLLVVAGVGLVTFAIMQPLAVETVPAAQRGRALGAIALAIGLSPPGMVAVGFMSEAIGPQSAIAILTGVGMVVVAALWLRYPALRDAG